MTLSHGKLGPDEVQRRIEAAVKRQSPLARGRALVERSREEGRLGKVDEDLADLIDDDGLLPVDDDDVEPPVRPDPDVRNAGSP